MTEIRPFSKWTVESPWKHGAGPAANACTSNGKEDSALHVACLKQVLKSYGFVAWMYAKNERC